MGRIVMATAITAILGLAAPASAVENIPGTQQRVHTGLTDLSAKHGGHHARRAHHRHHDRGLHRGFTHSRHRGYGKH